MQEILFATLAIGVIGLVVGIGLVTASKKFYVEPDDRVSGVRECLRGSNCGACGYAGCDALAEAIVLGEAHMDACPGITTENIAKIAAILGKTTVSQVPHIACVRCRGNCNATKPKANYVGISDCRAAMLTGLSFASCTVGCLALGSCVKVCPQEAITVSDGVAHVDRKKCIGCGLCAKACPMNLIVMQERHASVYVLCSNRDKGALVRKTCQNGCIGCGICVKNCPHGAISIENNLAVVDQSKCVGCRSCLEVCPTKAIHAIRP